MSNVNTAEIEKFANHATEWWDDKNGPLKTLHQLNPARVGWIIQHAPLVDTAVLDVGCGGGILSEALARSGVQVTGLDMAQASIEVARQHAQEQGLNIDYHAATAEDWAEQHPDAYPVITCMELLEHVPDPASVIHAVAQMLSAGGTAFFSTINRTPKSGALTIGLAEYILRWIPKGTHQYDTFIKPSELSALVRQSGLEVVALAGVEYRPWLAKDAPFTVTADTSVNYMMCARKP